MADTNGNGRRWYDSAKVIWGLFGIVGTVVFALGVAMFNRLYALETRATSNETERARMEQKLDDVKAEVHEIKEELKRRK